MRPADHNLHLIRPNISFLFPVYCIVNRPGIFIKIFAILDFGFTKYFICLLNKIDGQTRVWSVLLEDKEATRLLQKGPIKIKEEN